LVDLLATEVVTELLTGEGIDFEVRGDGEEAAATEELQFLGDVAAEDVGATGGEFLQAGWGDIVGAGVDEEDLDAGIAEVFGCGDGPRGSTGEEDALGVGGGEAEAASDGAGEESVEGDGGDDDLEGERFEHGGVCLERVREETGFGSLGDLEGENGGDGGGDYSPGCEESEEEALAPGQAGAEGGEQDAHWADDQDEGGGEEQSGETDSLEGGEVEASGEDDKEAGDEEDA